MSISKVGRTNETLPSEQLNALYESSVLNWLTGLRRLALKAGEVKLLIKEGADSRFHLAIKHQDLPLDISVGILSYGQARHSEIDLRSASFSKPLLRVDIPGEDSAISRFSIDIPNPYYNKPLDFAIWTCNLGMTSYTNGSVHVERRIDKQNQVDIMFPYVLELTRDAPGNYQDLWTAYLAYRKKFRPFWRNTSAREHHEKHAKLIHESQSGILYTFASDTSTLSIPQYAPNQTIPNVVTGLLLQPTIVTPIDATQQPTAMVQSVQQSAQQATQVRNSLPNHLFFVIAGGTELGIPIANVSRDASGDRVLADPQDFGTFKFAPAKERDHEHLMRYLLFCYGMEGSMLFHDRYVYFERNLTDPNVICIEFRGKNEEPPYASALRICAQFVHRS